MSIIHGAQYPLAELTHSSLSQRAMIRRPPTSLTLSPAEVEDLRTSRIAATGVQMHVGSATEAQQHQRQHNDDDASTASSSSANDEDSGVPEHAADRERREREERSEAERIAGQR